MVRYFITSVTESQNIPLGADVILVTASTVNINLQLPKITADIDGKMYSIRRLDLLEDPNVGILAAEGDKVDNLAGRLLFPGGSNSIELVADDKLKKWHIIF